MINEEKFMHRKTAQIKCVPKRTVLSIALQISIIFPTVAFAQTAPPATDPKSNVSTKTEAASPKVDEVNKIEVIVVNARKRSEELQTVPVAISAFTADSLKRANIENAADIQFSVPSAILVGGDTFTIRGIGNGSLGGDAGVGVFLNGASVAPPSQDLFFDIERIEILRGPQGTLFGRNTTGGAINIATKQPTNKLGGELSIETGNFNERRVGGVFNIPFSENVAQRFAGYVYKRDGFTKNVFTGSKIDGRDQGSIRSSTRIQVSDNSALNIVLGLYNENSSRTRETKRLCKANAVLGCSPNELGFDSPAAGSTILQTLASRFTPFPAGGNIYAGALNPQNVREVAADTDPTFGLDQRNATLDYTHDFDSFDLTYVGGYSTFNTEQNTDWDNAALPFRFTRPITYLRNREAVVTTDQLLTSDSFTATSRTVSHEVRAASKFKGIFNFTAGAYYFESSGKVGFEAWHPAIEAVQRLQGRPPESWFINTKGRGTLETSAIFGETNFKISDKLRVALGARYTREDRTSISRNIVLSAPGPEREGSSSSSKTTGRVTVDFALTPSSFLYGSVATGYKGGGFNIGNTATPTFKPEEVTAYEIGWKNTLLNGSLQANFTGFYNDYKNLQLGQRIGGTVLTSNADSKTKGAEAEFVWSPTRALLFDANLSLLNTRIGSFLTVDGANPAQSLTATTPTVSVNLDGKELPYSPTKKYKLGGQFSLPIGAWTSIYRLDHVWQDSYFAREFNAPTDKISAWSVTNLQMRFISPSTNVQFKAYVKNLANKNNITRIVVEDALLGSYRNARYLDPRTFGVSLEYKF
jgi:iron complex outermembrane recepter protein